LPLRGRSAYCRRRFGLAQSVPERTRIAGRKESLHECDTTTAAFAAAIVAVSWLGGGTLPAVSRAESSGSLAQLEAAYGRPSQDAFGSAVLRRRLEAGEHLERASLAADRHFVGALWQQYGEEAWMRPWHLVYARGTRQTAAIVSELRGIEDADAKQSVPMPLDVVKNADAARAALAGVFDDPAVSELEVYNLGDGAAMSGLLIAARRAATGEATFLVFLMD
jgi:hypothetical protein